MSWRIFITNISEGKNFPNHTSLIIKATVLNLDLRETIHKHQDYRFNRLYCDIKEIIRIIQVVEKPGNNEPGGIIEKDMPLHVSNVAFYDAPSKKGIRVGYTFKEDGKKIRINKKSGKEI